MSQPFIYMACFFGGALAFCGLVQWFVYRRRKEALGKEFVLCVHCEKLIEKNVVDH
jgi:hypothetical protein